MTFVDKDFDHEVNVGKEKPLKVLLWLLASVAALLLILVVAGSTLSALVVDHISPSQEEKIFSHLTNLLGDVSAPTAAPDNPDTAPSTEQDVQNKVLEELVQKITPDDFRHSVSRIRVFTFRMSDMPPNAFAFPGPVFGVTRSLLDQCESENELAMVVAHELAHIHFQHPLKAMGRGLFFALIGAFFSYDNSSNTLFSTGSNLFNLSYSREQEIDADIWALNQLHRVYGHVKGATTFFEKAKRDNKDWEKLSKAFSYLSTHPAVDERIAFLLEYAKEKSWPLEGEMTLLQWR